MKRRRTKLNPIGRRALWIGAVAFGAAALVGGVALAASSGNKTATTPKSNPIQLPPELTHGKRYSIRVTAMGSYIARLPNQRCPTAQELQAAADHMQPGAIKVVSLGCDVSPSGAAMEIVIDVTGPTIPGKMVPQATIDKAAADGLTIKVVEIPSTVGGPSNAVDADKIWHAWKQLDSDPNDNGVDVYVGTNEDYAATAAAYWANQGYRTGYYATLP